MGIGEGEMSQVLEGTWEEILAHETSLRGKRVRLEVLANEAAPQEHPSSREARMMRFGMFPQLQALTEEDFKSAEWRGDDFEP
jgi:hypothetical protein